MNRLRRQRLDISLYPLFYTRVQRKNLPPHCSDDRTTPKQPLVQGERPPLWIRLETQSGAL